MKSYIGYSVDSEIRYKATSGGIGTSVLKWLFEKELIGTSISFDFNIETLKYEPKIIHSFNEYHICGSIYHELDLIGFIKSHLTEIQGGFACFALPCQTRAIRAIVKRAGHSVYILGLTCSSQQTIEATQYLLKRLYIRKEDIKNIQYRGNGWPSGIQIYLKDGNHIIVPNNASLWNRIFHSRLFIRWKCFMCQDTLNKYSDLTLADPWLPEFLDKEKNGKTLVLYNEFEGGKNILLQCAEDGYIDIEEINNEKAISSQQKTIVRKNSYRKSLTLVRKYVKIINSTFYQKMIECPLLFAAHCKIRVFFERYLVSKLPHNKA